MKDQNLTHTYSKNGHSTLIEIGRSWERTEFWSDSLPKSDMLFSSF